MDPRYSIPSRLFVYECHGPRSPVIEPSIEGYLGTWPEPPFYYLFFGRPAGEQVSRWIDLQEGWSLGGTYELDYDQWQQVIRGEHRVGPFVVRMGPGGQAIEPSRGGRVIEVDPGVVFGSGLHPSTRGCLLAIAWLWSGPAPETVVDLGTGTGILAMATGLLGASRVLALDCNPLAVSVTRKNVCSNGLEEVVHLLVAQELEVLRGPSDLLIMNLEWPSLTGVLRGRQWLRYRWIILSGFLESQWPKLEPLILPAYTLVHRETLEDWTTAVLNRVEP